MDCEFKEREQIIPPPSPSGAYELSISGNTITLTGPDGASSINLPIYDGATT